jgi:hypothetical protein
MGWWAFVLVLVSSLGLLTNGQSNCLQDFAQLQQQTYVNKTVSVQMLANSGTGPNNIGSYSGCRAVFPDAHVATYCTIQYEAATFALIALGGCLPISCTPEIITENLGVFAPGFPSDSWVHCGTNPDTDYGFAFGLCIFTLVILAGIFFVVICMKKKFSQSRTLNFFIPFLSLALRGVPYPGAQLPLGTALGSTA